MSAPAKSRSVPAKPAAPINAFRRSMIAKINIARQQLRIEEEDYRAQLAELTGKASLTKCSDGELTRVLDWLASKGFRAVQAKGGAVHPMARKARALWISLHHLGAVDNPSEQALEAFAKRQLGCEKLVWAKQSDAYRLIEALKAWAVREGWPEAGGSSSAASPVALQATLCGAILRKLKDAGLAQPGWGLAGAALQLCGRALPTRWTGDQPMTADDYRALAEQLGAVLRANTLGKKAD